MDARGSQQTQPSARPYDRRGSSRITPFACRDRRVHYQLSARRATAVAHHLRRSWPLEPRLIYASFSGYGETGAEANKPGFDSNAWWARSGLMDVVRSDAEATPARSVPGMGDHPSAVSLYAAIVTALYRREHTGKGGQVTTSLMANGVWSNGYFVQAKLCGASVEPRPRRERTFNALSNHYRCSDGRWLILSLDR